ncbi:MAG: hypothetical protein HYV14_05655 [Elusimicrobia bacterium]|nr:hypothetical protein [Elusimicrobiota bacterium]
MTVLFTAAIAVLAAQTALAEQRANKAFNTVNGRTSMAAPAGGRVITVNTPGGGIAANSPVSGQAPAVTNAMITGAPVDGGRAFVGGGRQAVSRGSSRGVRRGGKAFWSGGRSAVGPADAPAPVPGAEEAPPNYSKPGALIRTTGQQPVYEKAETRTHTVDAGEIVFNKRKGFDAGRAPGVRQGPKDTPPPPNPVTGGSSAYGNGAAANSTPTSGSSTPAKDNNGSGNNDKGKPGDDFDNQGGDKAMETGFYDAF